MSGNGRAGDGEAGLVTDFGYFLSGEELSPPEIVQYARTAEAAGFDRVWVSDHYRPWQSVQGESPFVWTVLGAIAATANLRMTTRAGEALNEHILGDAWPPVSIRLERLEEAIGVIRQLWTGETVTHQGRYFTVTMPGSEAVPSSRRPGDPRAASPDPGLLAHTVDELLRTATEVLAACPSPRDPTSQRRVATLACQPRSANLASAMHNLCHDWGR
jgi:alkanesulfonate monooxygenase SsuD/methylene tetrahydromethanopterin reductase-like flavin-dependent oxidoreductase (luciferase family)